MKTHEVKVPFTGHVIFRIKADDPAEAENLASWVKIKHMIVLEPGNQMPGEIEMVSTELDPSDYQRVFQVEAGLDCIDVVTTSKRSL